ncbi:MAG: flippase [Sphingobacteriales bacterium]|nr:flippase [Sphingobacteriales bacterium]
MNSRLIKQLFSGNEILKGGVISLFFKFSGIFIGYIFFIIISRWYGSGVLGIFSVCSTLLMMAGIMGRWGIDTLIIKYLSEDNLQGNVNQLRYDYFKGLRIVVFFSLLISLLILIFNKPIGLLFFKNKAESLLIFITALTIIPASIMGYTAESFRGLKKIIPYSLFQNASIYVVMLIILFFIRQRGNYNNYVVHALFFSILFLSVCCLIYFIVLLPKSLNHTPAEKRKIYEILKVSTPMMLGNSLYLIMNWTDILMIGAMLTKSDVGIYNSAVKTAALGSVALAAMNTIGAPKFAESFKKQGSEGLKYIARQTALYSLMISLPIFLLIFAFPGFVLSFFGDEFKSAIPTLIILASGQLFNTFAGSTMYILNMTGREKAGRNILFAGTIINIALNLILIPVMGISGAAVATACSTVLWNILAVVYIKRHFGFYTFPKFF